MSDAELYSDLNVAAGTSRAFEGDLFVNGWVTVVGALSVKGALTCHGVTLAGGGQLRCAYVTTNCLEVDPEARLIADGARARFVHHEQYSLGRLEQRVEADCIQHFAGEFNPGHDYVRGPDILRLEFVERRGRGEDHPSWISFGLIREAIAAGDSPFVDLPLLVTPRAAPPKPAAPELDPLVVECTAWFDRQEGPQRAALEGFAEGWASRFAGASPEALAQIQRLVRRRIKSPKLRARRDGVLASLG